MGIRFYCPNGHKLNVKAHLAGKTGFCPECGVRLVIPLQSTRKSSQEIEAEKEQSGHPVLDDIPPLDFGSEPEPAVVRPAPVNNSPAFVAEEPLRSAEVINPLLQDQTVIWYIQVPGGQQFGPADGQTVHGWIQERRITPAMLVWREGWANWLEAKNVFPELE